jgi:hypothetical protein
MAKGELIRDGDIYIYTHRSKESSDLKKSVENQITGTGYV